jgi:hypothetical protein
MPKSEPEPTPEHLKPGFVPEGMVECSGSCGMELPETAGYFDRDNERPSGFKSICKQCRSEDRAVKQEESERHQLIQAVNRLDEIALEILSGDYGGSVFGAIPHEATLYEEAISIFGGPKGMARHLMANYLSAKPGSQIRVKILDRVYGQAKTLSESGVAELPLDRMNEDALEDKRAEMEEILVEQAKRQIIHVKAQVKKK